MLQFVAKIFGSKSDKDIKRVKPLVDLTIAEGEKLVKLSNDELRQKTNEIRNQIDDRLKSIDDQLKALHQQIADHPELEITEKERIFSEIDELEKVIKILG